MTRSFPEKTFEHWCSMHLSYRYKAKMLMWWPSKGADIEITKSPQTWGKRFWLELKTTEWIGSRKTPHHALIVDLVQLRNYKRAGIPAYYVFPNPPWDGVLAPSTATPWLKKGLAPERLAYQSQSGGQWFAEWTFVVPGWALHNALSAEIKALPRSARKKKCRIATLSGGKITWLAPIVPPSIPMRSWRDFWVFMEKCGDAEWPAQFLIPANSGLTARPSRQDLVSSLQRLAEEGREFDGEPVVYNQMEGDSYVRQTDEQTPLSEAAWVKGTRVFVALNEHALYPGDHP